MKCRVVDRQEDGNGDSGGSFQNGHAQLMVSKSVIFHSKDFSILALSLLPLSTKSAFLRFPQTDFEKDVDIACRSGTASY